MRSYKDLEVWQLAVELAELCYQATASFPREEAFGMTAQIRRASVSIAANIAEGYGRELTGSFIQYLRVAQGSVKELETHWLIAERVKLTTSDEAAALLQSCERLSKMLRSLIRSLERKAAAE
ncbi:MAG: four helix bundle protein [Hyphomicrobium sp.]|nr:four helix bundle protein [Hyphomicrobium sp.]